MPSENFEKLVTLRLNLVGSVHKILRIFLTIIAKHLKIILIASIICLQHTYVVSYKLAN